MANSLVGVTMTAAVSCDLRGSGLAILIVMYLFACYYTAISKVLATPSVEWKLHNQ